MRLLAVFLSQKLSREERGRLLLSRTGIMQARPFSASRRGRGGTPGAATALTSTLLLPLPPPLPLSQRNPPRSFSSVWTTSSKPSLVAAAAAAAAAAAPASAEAAAQVGTAGSEASREGDDASAATATSRTASSFSSAPSSSSTPSTPSQLPPGAFAHLPVVPPSDEHFSVASRRAGRVRADPKIKNEAARARSWAARRLDALGQELCTPLGKMVAAFPPRSKLHPFERALLNLTLGIGKEGRYESTLARVDAGRRATLQAAKEAAAAAAKSKTKKEALEAEEQGKESIERAWKAKAAHAVDSLKDVAKSLRRLPVVDADSPTLALVGAPNVGKSSLVRALSSGEPAVADYPFTTRSVALGHFYVSGSNQRGDVSGRRQVTDTPGLLRRPQEDRDAMELLTLACLDHLPRAAVAFVSDGSGLCGTSVEDQWALRQELRQKYGARIPWVDVLTKADLLKEEYGIGNKGEKRGGGVADRSGAVDESVVVRTPEELSSALPRAVRVSTPEELGLDELKEAVMEAMEDL